MSSKSLVIMAAGMGSRFGGLKQMQPVDDNGCFIIDYSVYDAIRTGADHIIFVIKKEIEQDFKETVGARVEKHVKTSYVYQDLNDLPTGFFLPEGRKKPWGTGHAVLTARTAVDSPFVAINADDFYGREAFKEIFSVLTDLPPATCVMAGYELGNALSKTGGVSRGICRVDDSNSLLYVEEHHHIQREGNAASAKTQSGVNVSFPLNTLASLNFWGFNADIMPEFQRGFEVFLNETFESGADPTTTEFYLPDFVQRQITENKLEARVIPTKAEWSGITFKDDLDELIQRIAEYRKNEVYPDNLWK